MSYNIVLNIPVYVPCSATMSGGSAGSSPINSTLIGSKAGVRVENWRELVTKGLPASSAYSLDTYKLSTGSPLRDSLVMRNVSSSALATGTFSGYPGATWGLVPSMAHLVVDSAKARSVALSKLYKKLESDRSELNSYAVLAEMGDVLRQFGKPFSAIVAAFERHENRLIFERRRLVGSKTWRDESFRRIAAETWLEVSFGLIPLFSDATGVAEAFGRFEYELADSPRLRDRMRTRASESTVNFVNYSEKSGQPFNYIGYLTSREQRTTARSQYVVGLEGDVRADFGSNQRLMELLGLEPRNLPLAVWEATPWSWLADYAANVQQILQAGATVTSRVKWIVLSTTTQSVITWRSKLGHLGLNGVWSPVTFTSNKKEALINAFGSPNSSPEQAAIGNFGPLGAGDFRIVRTSFDRTLPATLGVPPLYFKTPFEDSKKVANLVALVVARQKSHQTWLS